MSLMGQNRKSSMRANVFRFAPVKRTCPGHRFRSIHDPTCEL
jgi:hypothetical protein